jgi:hypothetical protein
VVIDDQDSRGCHAAMVARAGSPHIGAVPRERGRGQG